MTQPIFSSPASVIILGHAHSGGTYILRLAVRQTITLALGRFKGGKPIAFPAGEYLYVGSALGKGSAGLARRLVRHASRTGQRPPHPIRAHLIACFSPTNPAALLPPTGKRLRWHIDYLLDQPAVDLLGVLAIGSGARLENPLGRWLLADPATFIVEPGLGASDDPGGTHLLGVRAGDGWWAQLPRRLDDAFAERFGPATPSAGS